MVCACLENRFELRIKRGKNIQLHTHSVNWRKILEVALGLVDKNAQLRLVFYYASVGFFGTVLIHFATSPDSAALPLGLHNITNFVVLLVGVIALICAFIAIAPYMVLALHYKKWNKAILASWMVFILLGWGFSAALAHDGSYRSIASSIFSGLLVAISTTHRNSPESSAPASNVLAEKH